MLRIHHLSQQPHPQPCSLTHSSQYRTQRIYIVRILGIRRDDLRQGPWELIFHNWTRQFCWIYGLLIIGDLISVARWPLSRLQNSKVAVEKWPCKYWWPWSGHEVALKNQLYSHFCSKMAVKNIKYGFKVQLNFKKLISQWTSPLKGQ